VYLSRRAHTARCCQKATTTSAWSCPSTSGRQTAPGSTPNSAGSHRKRRGPGVGRQQADATDRPGRTVSSRILS
jgi:hypothetical protein